VTVEMPKPFKNPMDNKNINIESAENNIIEEEKEENNITAPAQVHKKKTFPVKFNTKFNKNKPKKAG